MDVRGKQAAVAFFASKCTDIGQAKWRVSELRIEIIRSIAGRILSAGHNNISLGALLQSAPTLHMILSRRAFSGRSPAIIPTTVRWLIISANEAGALSKDRPSRQTVLTSNMLEIVLHEDIFHQRRLAAHGRRTGFMSPI
jgi:hypothetical protein